MVAANPLFSAFKFEISKDFFKSAIIDKYDEWLKIQPLNVDTMSSAVNQSIQSITLPSMGLDPIIQQQASSGGTIEVATTSVQPYESLVEDKNLTITMRHTNGFMNYFTMMEHYIQYANGTNGTIADFSSVPDFILMVTDNRKNVLFSINFTGVLFIGMDELELSKAKITNEFTTFQCRFRFNSFSLNFHTPERNTIHD